MYGCVHYMQIYPVKQLSDVEHKEGIVLWCIAIDRSALAFGTW